MDELPLWEDPDESDDDAPKKRFHDLGSEDGEMADWLEAHLDRGVIFNHGKNQWHLVNEQGLWLADKVRDVQRLVDEEAVRAITANALGNHDNKEAMQLVKVFRRLREVSRIESALKMLSARTDYKTDGSIFDQYPNLLGVKNGVLDLDTMKMVDPKKTRALYVSQSMAVEWPANPNKAAKEAVPFAEFLSDVMSGDSGVVEYVWRLLGYCLLGTSEQEKFWMAVGRGQNGKGTLLKYILWLMGDYGTSLDPALYIRSRYGDPGADRARPEIGNLWGRRYAVTSEPIKGEFNEQVLKAHSGRDPITFRRMRSDILWTFEPTHKLFFLTNDAPKVEDVGPSMRRRARIINFWQDYSARPNLKLADELKAVAQGVLVALAYQASEYLREGLPENEQVLKWSETYVNENDPLADFIEECCIVRPGATVTGGALWLTYEKWLTQGHQEDGLSQTAFGLKMSKKFNKKHTDKGAVYEGIMVRDGG